MANSSRNPNDVLRDAEQKGYSRILFQQGKPVCDFELTLLGDLANPQRMAAQYIGSGVPAGSDGFAIGDLDIAAGDFTIRAGRCLVNGAEVTLAADTTYRKQPHKPPAGSFPKGSVNIYLHVLTTEVTELQDDDLSNKGDVGIVTAVREKTDWEVLVSSTALKLTEHYLLATFRLSSKLQIDSATPTPVDRRRKGLTMAALRDEFDAFGGPNSLLNNRLDASLNPDGTLKSNVVGSTQIAGEAVNEANLASKAVSARHIQNAAVSISKLGLIQVFDGQTSVPPAKIVGDALQLTVPGETVISLQAADEHAFYLISVRVISQGLGKEGQLGSVNWIHRSAGVLKQKPDAEKLQTQSHEHQVVLQNFSTLGAVTAACRAFRIADS